MGPMLGEPGIYCGGGEAEWIREWCCRLSQFVSENK